MCHFYNGIPIDQVDFEQEFNKELAILEEHIAHLKAKQSCKDIRNKNYQYWALKINRANQALEVGQVVLSSKKNN